MFNSALFEAFYNYHRKTQGGITVADIIKNLYIKNSRVLKTIFTIVSLIILSIYFILFFQRGIYYNTSFYKKYNLDNGYIYKHSKDEYFQVNNDKDILTLKISNPKDVGTIEVRKHNDTQYSLLYPDNTVYKGEYKNGFFFRENESIRQDLHLNKDLKDVPSFEKYNNSFVLSTLLGEKVAFRGNFYILLLAFIFVIIGILHIKYPRQMLVYDERWKYCKDSGDIRLMEAGVTYCKYKSILFFTGAFIVFALAV